MDAILTAKVGTNDEQFPDILRLYIPEGSLVADVTWGRGIFWKRVSPDYRVLASDLSRVGDIVADFTALPYPNASLDAVILDPPYLYVGGFKTLRPAFQSGAAGSYGNIERATGKGIYGVEAVDRLYYDGMVEARRVLKPKGILVVKCMDQVMSGKQVWSHVTYLNYGEMLGFENLDLFVLVRKSRPLLRHKPENQKHARRNHSYFLVFRKSKCQSS